MNRKRGFTLVELLVVIAIITILASIVVPRVTDALRRARATKAASEIRGIDTAVTLMLSHADKSTVDKLFPPGEFYKAVAYAVFDQGEVVERVYSDIFYELLRRGKDAVFDMPYMQGGPVLQLSEPVRRKLSTSYMELGLDAWGTHPYFFFAGPLTTSDIYKNTPTPFRSNRGDGYEYTEDAKRDADAEMRGNPPWDDQPGYPSPKDMTVYIWSYGEDEVSSQIAGGGDDVNNWDTANGWMQYY